MNYRSPTDEELVRLRRSPRFDAALYAANYGEYAALAGMDVLSHFITFGASEEKPPHSGFSVQDFVASVPPMPAGELHPLVDYVLNAPDTSTQRKEIGGPLRVFLDTAVGVHLGENLGDVAMSAAAIQRFASASPGCEISIVVDDPRVLSFTGVPFKAISSTARARWLHDPTYPGGRQFAQALTRADIVAITGHGALVDFIAEQSIGLLRVLDAAMKQGSLTAVLGHGIGPFSDERLRRAASAVLPRLDMLCIRDERHSPAILTALGVPREHILITGDDATRVSAAPVSRPADRNSVTGFGLSIRQGYGMRKELASELVAIARKVAGNVNLNIVPLPIDCGDVQTLGRLGFPCDLWADPKGFLDAASQCRAVLAGSYHAAVFALSQGVPTVALSAGPFYRAKMSSLASWFPDGCKFVDLDTPSPASAVGEALSWALTRAQVDRRNLVVSARRQSQLGDDAVAKLVHMVSRPHTQIDSWRCRLFSSLFHR